MLSEFKKFIMRGNVVELAVAVIIGVAFGAVVTSLVNDIIGPIIGAILGGVNLSGQTLMIGNVALGTGNFVQAIINFLIVAFVLFLIVRAMNKVMPPPPPPAPGPTTEEQILAELKKLNETMAKQ
jgi:large conductance mechanosensitive channel